MIPTLGIWDDARDIDRDKLPSQFVLKTTGGSGNQNVFICRDKSNFDFRKAVVQLNKDLKSNSRGNFGEWQYKDVPLKIIAEKYMEDETGELRDYKFFCFDGKPKFLYVSSDLSLPGKERVTYYNIDTSIAPFQDHHYQQFY